MKGKWHITGKGVAALCRAEKKPCPLGQHFESEEEANEAVAKECEGDYGLLPKKENEDVKRRKDLADLVKRISGIKSKGFDYECFASVSMAEQLGLNKVAITDENGLIVNMNLDKSSSNSINADVYVKQSIESLNNYYKKQGLSVKDKNLLARVIYYSDDEEKGMLVQSGGPNVLDAAIIKADEIVDIIEVKKLEGGAQLPLISVNVNADGTMNEKTVAKQSIYIQDALKSVNIMDIDGNNLTLDFGSEDSNRKTPLYHFINEYKNKGATSFLYTTENGSKINIIDLTRPDKEVVKEMIEKGIEANVVLRGNLHKQNANKSDIERFNKMVSKDYFKSGKPSNTESFTLKSIKEDKISKSGEFVRIGGFVLPIKYDEYKDNLNKRIKKEDMKAFKFSLTGNITTNY